MFFLRAIFWIAIISVVLPDGIVDNAYRSAKTLALGSEIADDSTPYIDQVADESTGFCEDFAIACSAAASVRDFAHIQAIRVTGSLHEWLMDTYEPPKDPALADALAANETD